ncbi:MAG: CNNM domain-containing protein [Endomicrobium sp.]|jgi:CBS domain containing-hemolysin-like protein|nr:CNNM domain-containing protein [Endomicrobium sp.]
MFVFSGLTILFLLLLLSAWISAAEIGITSLSKYRVKKLIVQTPKLSKSLLLWLEHPYYLLTIILTINVIADMLMSFLSTFFMTSIFYMVNRHIVEVFVWIITSFTLLIFGEIVPKFYARANSEKITVISVPILSKMEKILNPFLYPVVKLIEFLSPRTSSSNSYELSKEEVENLLSEGGYSGEIDKETSIMLEHTLQFGELSIKRIMIPFKDIESVDLSLEEEDFLDRIVETSKSRIPVYIKSKSNIIGYVHIKDILILWQEKQGHFICSLVKPPYYVSEDKKINDLLKEFQSGKTHIAFVKDKNNNIVGMVTLENILEEIVGEILDEYD